MLCERNASTEKQKFSEPLESPDARSFKKLTFFCPNSLFIFIHFASPTKLGAFKRSEHRSGHYISLFFEGKKRVQTEAIIDITKKLSKGKPLQEGVSWVVNTKSHLCPFGAHLCTELTHSFFLLVGNGCQVFLLSFAIYSASF